MTADFRRVDFPDFSPPKYLPKEDFSGYFFDLPPIQGEANPECCQKKESKDSSPSLAICLSIRFDSLSSLGVYLDQFFKARTGAPLFGNLGPKDIVVVDAGEPSDGEIAFELLDPCKASVRSKVFLDSAGRIYNKNDGCECNIGKISKEDAGALIVVLAGKEELGDVPAPSEDHIATVSYMLGMFNFATEYKPFDLLKIEPYVGPGLNVFDLILWPNGF